MFMFLVLFLTSHIILSTSVDCGRQLKATYKTNGFYQVLGGKNVFFFSLTANTICRLDMISLRDSSLYYFDLFQVKVKCLTVGMESIPGYIQKLPRQGPRQPTLGNYA